MMAISKSRCKEQLCEERTPRATATTCFILTGLAKEAGEFYAEALGASDLSPVPDGQGGVMLYTFTALGHHFVVLNGAGPDADVQSQRVSTQIVVDGQDEFDRYWDALLAHGGTPSMNGWLVDRFGVWWDIVPVQQMQIFQKAAADPAAMGRVAQAAFSMQRIVIADLERAAAGE